MDGLSQLAFHQDVGEHLKRPASQRMHALLHPDCPCLVPISHENRQGQSNASLQAASTPPHTPRVSDVSMSGQSRSVGSARQLPRRGRYPRFSQRPPLQQPRQTQSSSSFRVPLDDSDSDHCDGGFASTASFVMRIPSLQGDHLRPASTSLI